MQKYLVAALFIIIPLYPKFPFIKIPGIYVSIRIEDFLLAIIAIITFIKLIPKIKEILKDNIVRSILLFLLIGGISLVSGAFLTNTVSLPIGILHLFRRIEYFVPLFFVLAFFPENNTKNLGFYLKTLMLVMLILFAYGVGQRYLRFPVIITQNEEYSKGVALVWTEGSHINSTFAGHYDLAAFIVLILPIFVSLFFVLKDKISKLMMILVSLSGFWLLVNSLSRVSLASFLFSISIALFLMKKYREIVIVVLICLVLGAFSPSLTARYQRIIDVFLEVKAQEVQVFEDRSTSIRFNVEWPRAIRAFSKNPLLGTGYSSIGLATDNDYLRLLGEVGILGFFAFVLIFFNIAKVFFKSLPLTKRFTGIELATIAGVIGGICGTLITAIFIDVFEASKFAIIFWFLVGLSVCMVRIKLNDQKN